MAITSVGFSGSVSAAEFAQLSVHQGALVPVVCGRNDLAVAANPGATLTCTIAAGSAAGQGVLTTSSATESVTFAAVSTPGQTRWDAVVLRRNWASSGSASFVVVPGTAAASAPMVLPSGVDLTLDSTHDQVLALVQITYGNTVPTQVVDRRLQGSKLFAAPALSALPPASLALYGMEAVLPTGERYRCVTDSGGSPSWVGNATPRLYRYRGTNFTNASNSDLTVDYNIAESGMATAGLAYSAGVVTVGKAGNYQVNATLMQSSTQTAGARALFILRNGSVWAQTNTPGGQDMSAAISKSVPCSVGDTIAIRTRQNSGATVTYVGSTDRQSYLDITYMGA